MTATTVDRGAESSAAWLRLCVALAISTIGGVGMWSGVVALPAVEAEFGLDRAQASLPYTLTMVGFAGGSVVMGRLADRFGIVVPIIVAALSLAIGYVAAGQSTALWQFALAHFLLIGFGTGAMFGPLIADISHWFTARRGLAVALCASGNYLSGTIWPPVVEHFIRTEGWRATHVGIGLFCVATMLPLAFAMRGKAPEHHAVAADASAAGAQEALGLSRGTLQALLVLAGLTCCLAMSMPQVHLVAYCGDLGYGVARGAEMLSLMLGCGIISRIASGWIADRIGGLPTLLLGSAMQAMALVLYTIFNGLTSLYIVSALFGLFQGGIVPSYAIVVRQFFPAREAGTRLGLVVMATILGMALGGWMSGAIFDLTGSYRAAFANGVAWNLVNAAIALFLLQRSTRARPAAA